MHELALAEALLGVVQEHAPGTGRVERIGVYCGAGAAVEESALQCGWQVLTAGTGLEGSVLELEIALWQLHCHACGRQWPGPEPLADCACGSRDVTCSGTHELTLRWLQTDEPESLAPTTGEADESSSR